jgi:hypothetical protein
VAKCELFAAAFWIARCIAPISAWVEEMNDGNSTSWVSLTVCEQNALRARIPFSCGAVATKITALFGFAASIRIPAAVALLYVRGGISHGCIVDERKFLLTSTDDMLFISLSERVSPIALAEKIENGRFLYRRKRRAANSKAIRSVGTLPCLRKNIAISCPKGRMERRDEGRN